MRESKNVSSRFQRWANKVTPKEATENDGILYEHLSFKTGSSNQKQYPLHDTIDLCLNCCLPACIKEDDFEAQMSIIGLKPKNLYCPIWLCAIFGQDEDKQPRLTFDQAQDVAHIAVKLRYKPEWLASMARQWVERNELSRLPQEQLPYANLKTD